MSNKTVINSDNAPKAIGPYSQAISTETMVFTSGQLPIDPATGKIVEGDIRSQAEQAIKNLGAILSEAGLAYDNVVKTTVFLADLADFAAVNEVYARFFTHDCPARSCFQVAALPMGARIEIEAISVR